MCGFVGIADFKNDISNKKEILLNMNSTLSKRGPDEDRKSTRLNSSHIL